MPSKSEYRRLCATAKSRAGLVEQVRSLASDIGVVFNSHTNDLRPRAVTVELVAGPYRVFALFNGASRVDAFLGHWHMDMHDREATYPVEFAAAIRGAINTCHFRKATTCADTFAGFLWSLRAGFTCLKENGLLEHLEPQA